MPTVNSSQRAVSRGRRRNDDSPDGRPAAVKLQDPKGKRPDRSVSRARARSHGQPASKLHSVHGVDGVTTTSEVTALGAMLPSRPLLWWTFVFMLPAVTYLYWSQTVSAKITLSSSLPRLYLVDTLPQQNPDFYKQVWTPPSSLEHAAFMDSQMLLDTSMGIARSKVQGFEARLLQNFAPHILQDLRQASCQFSIAVLSQMRQDHTEVLEVLQRLSNECWSINQSDLVSGRHFDRMWTEVQRTYSGEVRASTALARPVLEVVGQLREYSAWNATLTTYRLALAAMCRQTDATASTHASFSRRVSALVEALIRHKAAQPTLRNANGLVHCSRSKGQEMADDFSSTVANLVEHNSTAKSLALRYLRTLWV